MKRLHYEVRFWNKWGECIKIGGKYSHAFETYQDAWDGANALLISAHKKHAVEMDINNEFFPIIED